MRRRLTGVLLVVGVIGCRDRERIVAPASSSAPVPATAAPVAQRVVAIGVSKLEPELGDTVVVDARVGVGDSLSLASFVVRLAYDAHALHYLGEVTLPGMMRVVNPRATDVVVAAALGTGSSDGRLFALRFVVNDPSGLRSLDLTIDEMNDRDFKNQTASVTRAPGLRFDPKLVSAR